MQGNWIVEPACWYCTWYNTCANSTLCSLEDKWSNRHEKHLWKKNRYTNKKTLFISFLFGPAVQIQCCSVPSIKVVQWLQRPNFILKPKLIWFSDCVPLELSGSLIINNKSLNIDDNYCDIFVTVCMVQIMSMLRRTNKNNIHKC